MDLSIPDREALQCRLSASEDADNPLPDIDRKILELLLDTPLKRVNPCTEKFILYQTTMDVYDAACSGRVSSHNGVQLLQNHNKRQVYDLLFNAISREFLILLYNVFCCIEVCHKKKQKKTLGITLLAGIPR